MRKITLIAVLLVVFFGKMNAQDSGVSFELHYPILIPDATNYVSETNGVIGGGIGFQFSDADVFNYGLKYKFDQISSRTTLIGSNTSNSLNFMIHSINAFGTVNLNNSQTVKGVVEAGIAFYKYRESTTQPSYFGFDLGPGINVEFNEQFYAFGSYNFLKTQLKQKQTGYIESEKLQAIRIGVGFKL